MPACAPTRPHPTARVVVAAARRLVHKVWRKDGGRIMGLCMADCCAQLVLRVIPLVMLLEHHLYAGLGLAGACILWAFIITGYAWRDSESDGEESCCDLAVFSFLFSPHSIFFAMTYFPGRKVEIRSKQPRQREQQHIQRASGDRDREDVWSAGYNSVSA